MKSAFRSFKTISVALLLSFSAFIGGFALTPSASASTSVDQPLQANLTGNGSDQFVQVTGSCLGSTEYYGDGSVNDVYMSASCTFAETLPSGYVWVSTSTTVVTGTSCSSGTCSTFSQKYEQAATTVTLPVSASLSGSGADQYVTASGCGIGSTEFYGNGGVNDLFPAPSCTVTLTLPAGYTWVSTGTTTVTDTSCSPAGSTCSTFSQSYQQTATTVDQPVQASLSGSGSTQLVTVTGCGLGSTQFYGDGSVNQLYASPSCTITLTLPSPYVWASTGSATTTVTTCSPAGNTCPSFSQSYQQSITTVTQPVEASLTGSGSSQYITASGCGIGSSQFYGDGSSGLADFTMSPSCTFTLTVPSGYVWVSTGTTSITGTTCSPAGSTCTTFSATYEQAATTVTQPVQASLSGSGATQYVTASGCGIGSTQFYGDGSVNDIYPTPTCTFTLTLPSGYDWVSTGTTTITGNSCSPAGSTCSAFSADYEQVITAITQPVEAAFDGTNGGSQQTVTISGCGATPSTFAGDGTSHSITMSPSCAFTLVLPSGYQFIGGSGTTTCSSGICSTYSTSYEAVSATVNQPVTASFNNVNGGVQQAVTITGCNPSPSSFSGDGTSHSITMSPSCTFTLSLPSGYQFVGGSSSTTCSSGTCNAYSTSYEAVAATVTQPIIATFNNVNGGSEQTVSISGCSPSPSSFPGDGSSHSVSMSPSCSFTLSLPSGYQFTGGSGSTSCSSGTCSTYSTTYEATVTTGSLSITLTGFPSSQSAEVSVTGPGGYSALPSISGGGTDTLAGLAPGTYTVGPGLTAGYQPTQGTYMETVSAGQTTSVTIPYVPATVTQPITATFNNANGGSQQTISISGCSPSPSSFAGDGTSHSITMAPSCTFELSLPSGYQFTGVTGATSCSSGTCSAFTTTYEATPPTTGSLSITLTGFSSSQSAEVSINGPNGYSALPSISGGGTDTLTNLMPGTYTVEPGLTAGYRPTQGTYTETVTAGQTISVTIPYAPTTTSITQPITATFNNANGGSQQTITVSGCNASPSTFTGDGASHSITMSPSCAFTLVLPSGYQFVGGSSSTTCSSGTCNAYSTSYEVVATAVTQPITAAFNNVNGGSQQTITITGCSPSPSTFPGDGSSHSITMNPSCSFVLSLPSGYQFTGVTGATSCSSGTCSAFTTTYEATAPTAGSLSITLTGFPSSQSAEVSVTGPGGYSVLPSISGGGTDTITGLAPGTYTVEPRLTAGYRPTQGTYTEAVTAGQTTSVTIPYVPTTVTQPIAATFSNVNGGSQQTVTISGCSPSPTTFAGDGTSHSITMSPVCAFSLSLPSGYQFVGGTGTATCSSGTCSTYTTSYEATPPAMGRLSITLTGFPSSQSAEVSITGPNGYSALPSISEGGTDTLANLSPGTYTVEPGLTAGYQPTQGTYTETVTAGQRTSVTIPYIPDLPTISAAPNPCAGNTNGQNIPWYTGNGNYQCITESEYNSQPAGFYNIQCSEGGTYTNGLWVCNNSSPPYGNQQYEDCLVNGLGFTVGCDPAGLSTDLISSFVPGGSQISAIAAAASLVLNHSPGWTTVCAAVSIGTSLSSSAPSALIGLAFTGACDASSLFGGSDTPTSTTTTTVKDGAASANMVDSTGVLVEITAPGASDGTALSVRSTSFTGLPTGQASPPVNGGAFYDVQITGLSQGTATVCITNSKFTSQSSMLYATEGSWSSASQVVVSGHTVCGGIPVDALSGTTVVVGSPPTTSSNLELAIVLIAVIAVTASVIIWRRHRPR